MKALAVLLGTLCALVYLYAVVTFEPRPSQAAAHAAVDAAHRPAAMREVTQATDTCALLLGWTESTKLTQHDMAAFALCMHPTLKKHNLLKKGTD